MYDSLAARGPVIHHGLLLLMMGENGLKHRGIRKLRMVAVLVLFSCTSLLGGEKDKVLPTALQNQILRSHFRDQFLSLHSFVEPYETPSRFAQTFVDRQIKHFLDRVEGKLEILQHSVDDLIEIRRQVVDGESELNSKVRSHWREQTRKISHSAEDLRQMLAVIFLQLRAKDDFQPQVNRAENNFLFEVELRRLNRETEAATRLIRSYLFNAASTVHITDLRHTNMLIFLYHIRQTARMLQKKI